ncbi:MAG TPA: formate dehydrogenase accessory sulfurtransferase FdhD [Povalibacter sp.]|nr:formate dehydrogenase accessory sulfurtransferase FdhD [Povalibacter sp.]
MADPRPAPAEDDSVPPASPAAPREGGASIRFGDGPTPLSYGAGAPLLEVSVDRWRDGTSERVTDRVAEESPVALIYHGVSHVVMLSTPADLEDLGVGFTLSEGIVERSDEIHSVECQRRDDGAFEVKIGIAAERFSQLLRRQRNTTGRTGCGLCGAATIEEAIRSPSVGATTVHVSVAELHEALIAINQHQAINAQTGSVHAAAWVLPGKGIQVVREDVGRHNALDKVIGAVVRSGQDLRQGWFLITSRASYEMVQKTASVGVALLAAVSAPTAFAIRLAGHSGLTLIGFARERQHVVYTGRRRVSP